MIRKSKLLYDIFYSVAFRTFAVEEFLSRRNIVKEIPDNESGAVHSGNLFHLSYFPAFYKDTMGEKVLFRFRNQFHIGNRGDRRQRLAAKTETHDTFQVGQGTNFTRCMRKKSVLKIVLGNAVSVIGDAKVLYSSSSNFHRDLRGMCIDCIFHKFFHNTARTFNYFPCRYLVYRICTQNMNFHCRSSFNSNNKLQASKGLIFSGTVSLNFRRTFSSPSVCAFSS